MILRGNRNFLCQFNLQMRRVHFLVFRKMNKTSKAVLMLKKCLHLNANYISAYLLLAKMYDGPIAGRLLKHVTKLQSTNPNYFAYYAQWLHKKRKYLFIIWLLHVFFYPTKCVNST